jgi:hypothetical protein
MNSIRAVLNDETLYGHSLTALPAKINNFAEDDLYYWGNQRQVLEHHPLGNWVEHRYENARYIRFEFFGEKPIFGLIEAIVRRILSPLVAVFCSFTLAPIGFGIKLLHFTARSIAASALAEKISQIWQDATLYGHSLTAKAVQWADSASTPLNWHLRPDGTDRRHTFYTAFDLNGPGRRVHFAGHRFLAQDAEYSIVPFEIFETVYRRIFCSSMTLLTAPIGMAAKMAHVAARKFMG